MNAREAYKTMTAALRATGRPIVFSLCEWGTHQPWLWAGGVGELYRTTGDITARFDADKNMGDWTASCVLSILDLQKPIRKYNGPNHWNDPDMMEVGNGMTTTEDKSHFSLWCMLSAPLNAGNDLRKMSPQTRDILTNTELIALDQDVLGKSAYQIILPDSLEVWVKPLKNNEIAVCFLNRTHVSRKLKLNWTNLKISDELSGLDVHFDKQVYNLRDLWLKKDVGTTAKQIEQDIPSHDVFVLKLTKKS